MNARTVELPEALDRFVETQVGSGQYADANEVVRAGLRLLKRSTEAEAARIEALRAAVQVGLDELERGEGIEVTDIGAWLDSLGQDDEDA